MTHAFPRLCIAAAAAALVLACHPKSGAIASPESDAAQPGAGSTDATTGTRDVASVCADATAVASRQAVVPYDRGPGDASVAVFGMLGDKADRYSLADLQALEKKGQHLELLQHIEDVAPTARTSGWDALLARAATKVVGSLATEGDTYRAFEAMMVAEGLLQRYPQLAKTSEFMTARSGAGEHMFAKCFEATYSGEECVSMALDFVRVAGTDAATSLAVAKIVRRNQNPYVAVPFFRIALEGKDRAACGDDDLELATTAGLGLPPDYDNAKASRDIAQNVCFEELQAPIVARLTGDDGGGYFKDNACAVLRAKGVVE
ncbi:MAG: hypothetical protein JNK45_06465 [Myxococcales bacterium]|nr:hypothetical protein [Myxococcales bacterium]